MAEIRKIVRSNPLSAFRQVAPSAGGAFAVLADMANEAYDVLAPVAEQEMIRRGDEENRALARQQIGANTVPTGPVAPSGPDLSTVAPIPQLPGPVDDTSPLTAPPRVTTDRIDPNSGTFSEDRARQAIDRSEGGLTETVSSMGTGYSTAFEFQMGPNRPNQPRQEILDVIGLAAEDAFGPGARVVVTSGTENPGEQHGSNRHRTGLAADFAIYAPDGTRITSTDPRAAEFARAAASRGALGIGYGQEYMGGDHFHIDMVQPGAGQGHAWASGADAIEQELVALMTGNTMPPTATMSTSTSPTATGMTPPAPTMIRTADGRLQPRRYSPFSGPLLQAYNAAANVAFLSEAMMAGQADLMNISAANPLNPDAFLEQARSYVDQTVAAADPMLRRDLRADLETEVQRRFLGMMDERNDDIRRRAENSSAAIVDRWSDNYVEALASGNMGEAESARAQLEAALYARESLPGAAWTREQSANVLIQAERQSRRLQADRATQQTAEWRGMLDTSIAAHKAGLSGAFDGLLDNPAVVAALPEEAEELAAWIEFNGAMPGFRALPPDQQDVVIADMQAQPVQDRYQISMIEKAEQSAAASRQAWERDPIGYAEEVMDIPPPSLPGFDPNNPTAFIAGLEARRDYALNLQAQGFVRQPVFLSQAEAEQIGTVMGKDMPAEIRLAAASALAQGFGPNAVTAFQQMNIDPVLRHGASMLAVGGSEAVAAEALRGQQMMDEGLVSVPARLTRLDGVDPAISAALMGIPADDIGITAEVTAFAAAIYANRARGIDPDSEEARLLMAESVQAALGQAEIGGRLTGGVQTIAGQPTWLPIGVSGESMNDALMTLNRALPGGGIMTSYERMGQAVTGTAPNPDQWRDVAPDGAEASIPYVGNAPMDRSLLAGGHVRLVPMGGNTYRMEVVRSGQVLDVATETGALFLLDAQKLMGTVLP